MKNISKNLVSKYGQKRLGSAKKSGTHPLQYVSKTAFQNTAETPGHLIRNKIAGKLENTSAQNASETNTFLQTEDV